MMINNERKQAMGIMLVNDQPDEQKSFNDTLEGLGFEVTASIESTSDLLAAVITSCPDVVLIAVEKPEKTLFEKLARMQEQAPKPIVMLSQDKTEKAINQATELGVNAYVVDSFQPSRLGSIIDAAIARFRHLNEIVTKLEKTEHKLSERKIIDRAKGIIMTQKGLPEEQAYRWMQKYAMNNNRKITEVAQELIASLHEPNK